MAIRFPEQEHLPGVVPMGVLTPGPGQVTMHLTINRVNWTDRRLVVGVHIWRSEDAGTTWRFFKGFTTEGGIFRNPKGEIDMTTQWKGGIPATTDQTRYLVQMTTGNVAARLSVDVEFA